jgi:autotransporter translocation and assembly factor TamB
LKGEGRAGPWKSGTPGQTPISGVFHYANADLTAFANLHGILAAKGNFQGTFTNVNVSGTLSVPDFRVDRSAHSVALTAAYRASVNARNADVRLERVEAHVAHTTILANGRIDGQNGQQGKTAHIELAVHRGRVEDLLNYFSEEQKASMTGAVTLHAFVEVPPGPHFLKKLRLTGDFGVESGEFTSSSTQTPINALSASARAKADKEDEADKEAKAEKEDARPAASNLRSHVLVRDGTAELTGISFEFPGAIANMDGTFQLISKQVDIHGTLRTIGSLPDTTSGFKALMLQVATPFMKKRNTTVAPFAITGTSSDPRVGLDLAHKRKF